MLLLRTARTSLLESCALAWVLGTGVVSLMLWIASFVLSGNGLLVVVTSGCLALTAAGFVSAKRSHTRLSLTWPAHLLEWLLAGIVILQIIAVFTAAFRHQLGWDGLLIWEAKARFAFLAGGSLPSTYFQSTSWEFTHVGYPLLLPLTETWCYLWMGEPHQFWVKAIFPMFYLASVALLGCAATRVAGSRRIGWGIAALLFFVPYVTSIDGGVVVGYADFPLSVLYVAAVGYLISFSESGRAEAFRLYAACLMFLPWMKREGVILWLVAAVCGALLAWRRKKSLLLWLLPGALIIADWRVYLAAVHARVPNEYLPVTASTLIANVNRLGSICAALF